MLGADEMIPGQYRQSGLRGLSDARGQLGERVVHACGRTSSVSILHDMTLVCGTAGFDGTQFKNLLASEYNIQLNKTSRNSVLLQSNINNTRSDVAHLIRVLVEISRDDRKRGSQQGGDGERRGIRGAG